MNEILKAVLFLSLSGSIVALVVYLLKAALKNRFSRTWQYYIWLVVLLRFLVPFAPEVNVMGAVSARTGQAAMARTSPAGPEADFGADSRDTTDNDANVMNPAAPAKNVQKGEQDPVQPVIPNTPEEAPRTNTLWTDIRNNLWMAWFTVAVVLFVRKVTAYNQFTRYVKAGGKRVSDRGVLGVYEMACAQVKIRRRIHLYHNSAVNSPMLSGMLKPVIILPNTELEEADLYHIFLHELTHYRRMDWAIKWLTQTVLCIHWFNPLVHLIARTVGKDCELSCDESVIRRMNGIGKRQYGNALMASIKSVGTYNDKVVSLTMSEDGRLLKERFEAIMKYGKKSGTVVALSLVLALTVSCGAAFMGGYNRTESGEDLESRESSAADKTTESEGSEEETEDTNYKAKIEEYEADALSLRVTNASISLIPSEDGKYHVTYDDTRYAVTTSIGSGTYTCTVKNLRENYSNYWNERVIIQVPQQAYEHIQVNAVNSGVKLWEFWAPMDIEITNGALSVFAPEGYEGNLNLTATNSAVSLKLHENLTDCGMFLDSTSSAVGTFRKPPEDKDAAAVFNIDVTNCAMSVGEYADIESADDFTSEDWDMDLDLDFSGIEIPVINIPEITIPEINIPDIAIPSVNLPIFADTIDYASVLDRTRNLELKEDAQVTISVFATTDSGDLNFVVEDESGKIVYEVNGGEIYSRKILDLDKGTYTMTMSGTDLYDVEYYISFNFGDAAYQLN